MKNIKNYTTEEGHGYSFHKSRMKHKDSSRPILLDAILERLKLYVDVTDQKTSDDN